MFIRELKELGLNPAEAAIYVFLLEHGDTSASEIAKEVGIGRTNVYEYTDLLRGKGLISEYERKKKRIFHAAAPGELRNLVQKQLDKAHEQENNLQYLLPKLDELYQASSGMPVLKQYMGDKGYREINNILYLYGNERELYICMHDLNNYAPPEPRYRSSVQNRQLFLYLLVNQGELLVDFMKRDQKENRRTVIVSSQFRLDLAISEDKIIFGSFDPQNFRVSLLVSAPLADLCKSLLKAMLV